MGALGPARIRVAPAQPQGRSGAGRQASPAAGEACAIAGMHDPAPPIGAPSSMLDAFLVTVVRLAGARAGAVRALAADGDRLQLVAAFGLPADVLEREALIHDCGVCGEALRAEGVQVADDPSRCGRLAAGSSFHKVCTGTVAVPLEYKGRPVGVFTLFFDGVDNLRGDVIHLLRPVGQLFGLALENARLERENLQSSLLHERQTMAGEIHDSLAQSLTFVRMRMPLLQDAITSQDQARALRYCDDVNEELGSANRRMRELITQFRAGMDSQGLRRALERIADTFFERSGIALDFQCAGEDLGLTADQEVQLFHVAQELLANVRRHSGARHASMRIERKARQLTLQVADDGRGFPAAVLDSASGQPCAGAGFGLQILCERAQSIGASVTLENAVGGGARVSVRLPLARPGASAGRAPALAEVRRG